jgi:hypothetical protein
MTEKSETNSARNALILAAVVILIAGYCIAFGLQTLVAFEAHHWTRDNAWITDVPDPLNAQAPAAGSTQLRAFNYEFKVPWTGKQKTNETLTYHEFRFDSGQVVILYDPEAQLDPVHTLKASSPLEYQQLQNVFGGQPLDTNYALYQAVYGALPAATSPFMPMRDAIRTNDLLLWKISFGYDAMPGLHSIGFGENRGFQFGDPSTGGAVALRIFDGRDSQLRFIFLTQAGSNAKIDQADINAAVQSLQPVPIIER